MGKIISQVINRFDGGISNDIRVKDTRYFALARNFDANSYAHKLVPSFSTEAAETKAYDIVRFLYVQRATNTYKLFGFGSTGSSLTKIYYWNGTAWDTYTNQESSVGARSEDVFFYYKGYFYIFKAGTTLIKIDATSTNPINDSFQSISYTNLAQPVHHPNDDIAYFFTDNLVHKYNNSSWSGSVLTLPDNLKITVACPYGNYLAIACTDLKDKDRKSVVYLWDRDESLATLSDKIDFGSGEIIHLATLNNKLTAIVKNYPDIIIKQANGNYGVTLNTIESSSTAFGDTYFPRTNYIGSNVLYFPMDLDCDGGERCGIWAIDDKGMLWMELFVDGATSYQGIFNDNYNWWIAHSNDGSVDKSTTTYPTYYSTYDTLMLGEPHQNKKLLSVGVIFSPENDGTIKLEYRKKEADSWTTIFTHTVSGDNYYEAINIESDGSNFPEYREIQFRVSSKNGVVILGLKYTYEEVDSNLN